MIDLDLFKRYQFFKANAGGIVGRAATYALELAHAERWAEQAGIDFHWGEDYDADWSWMSEEEQAMEHEVLFCQVIGEGGIVAALYGIFDPSRDYRRVVQAELAAEVRAYLAPTTSAALAC